MDYIKTSDVSDPNIQQPFTALSLAFLQNASKEAMRGMVYNMIGEYLYGSVSPFAGVVVSGCTKAGAGNTIFYGWIFFNGELYYFPGASGLNSFGFTPVFVLDEYADVTIDPVEFTDYVSRDVHKIKRLRVVDQPTGTGLFDMSAMGRYINPLIFSGSTTSTASASAIDVPNTTFTSPNRVSRLKFTLSGSISFAGSIGGEGAYLILRNTTTSVDVAQQLAQLAGSGVAGGYLPTSFTFIIESVPANTVFKMQLKRYATNDATVTYPYLQVEEVGAKMW